MSDVWTDRLSEYLDGDLSEVERAGLAAHLEECADCVSTLDELRAVAARASALEDRSPAANLWPGIAQRIGAAQVDRSAVVDIRGRRSVPRRRVTFSLPQLIAAGIALTVVSGGGVWLARSGESAPVVRVVATQPGSGTATAVLAGFSSSEYDRAVAQLLEILEDARDQLDPNTVRVLQQSLATIDQAIEEAREALASDPANGYVSAHLAATMKRKVQLLRRAARIATAAS